VTTKPYPTTDRPRPHACRTSNSTSCTAFGLSALPHSTSSTDRRPNPAPPATAVVCRLDLAALLGMCLARLGRKPIPDFFPLFRVDLFVIDRGARDPFEGPALPARPFNPMNFVMRRTDIWPHTEDRLAFPGPGIQHKGMGHEVPCPVQGRTARAGHRPDRLFPPADTRGFLRLLHVVRRTKKTNNPNHFVNRQRPCPLH